MNPWMGDTTSEPLYLLVTKKEKFPLNVRFFYHIDCLNLQSWYTIYILDAKPSPRKSSSSLFSTVGCSRATLAISLWSLGTLEMYFVWTYTHLTCMFYFTSITSYKCYLYTYRGSNESAILIECMDGCLHLLPFHYSEGICELFGTNP
jgi:hypothetical protein